MTIGFIHMRLYFYTSYQIKVQCWKWGVLYPNRPRLTPSLISNQMSSPLKFTNQKNNDANPSHTSLYHTPPTPILICNCFLKNAIIIGRHTVFFLLGDLISFKIVLICVIYINIIVLCLENPRRVELLNVSHPQVYCVYKVDVHVNIYRPYQACNT